MDRLEGNFNGQSFEFNEERKVEEYKSSVWQRCSVKSVEKVAGGAGARNKFGSPAERKVKASHLHHFVESWQQQLVVGGQSDVSSEDAATFNAADEWPNAIDLHKISLSDFLN